MYFDFEEYVDDSENIDVYFYLLMVYMGLWCDGGIKFNVNFIVGGEDGDIGVRVFSDGFMMVVYYVCEWKY